MNPGAAFQAEIKASIPKAAGKRSPYAFKPPDVPQFGLRCRKCHRGQLKRRCTVCRREDAFDPRFTPKHPFDLLVSIPCKGTGRMRSSVVPQIVFAFELKRTAGQYLKKNPDELHGLLGFKDVKDHQVSGLQKIQAAGGVAGVLWLVESERESACHLILIDRWIAYRDAKAGRASMSLSAARVQGIEVEEDVGRGRSKRYWKLAELFRHFGADVEATPARKAPKPKVEPRPRLFDDLPAPAEGFQG